MLAIIKVMLMQTNGSIVVNIEPIIAANAKTHNNLKDYNYMKTDLYVLLAIKLISRHWTMIILSARNTIIMD